LAETGSGKTAAFALPILQKLMENPSSFFSLVLSPTRELAYQIAQAFEALGSTINVRTCCLVGGMDMVPQSIALGKKVGPEYNFPNLITNILYSPILSSLPLVVSSITLRTLKGESAHTHN
jgi:hypothetical protein